MNSISMSPKSAKLSTKELCCLALMGGLMMGLKVVMASLPNIEPVSLLIILTTLLFGTKALYSVGVYVLLEGLLYGFGIWFISYLYVWPLLVIATLLVKPLKSYALLLLLSTVFGLCFGALCAIPYFFTGGWQGAFSYWISGIPFDLMHAGGNAVISAILLIPLHKLLCKLIGLPDWKNTKGTALSGNSGEVKKQ